MLDNEQLRSFVAIVDCGSFTQAADRVNKTQSAVSMHIRRLEQRLGRTLFVKDGRGVRLSGDGERLVPHARRILDAEAAAVADLSPGGLSGRVVFGLPDDYVPTFLGAIIDGVRATYPRIELLVRCDDSRKLRERVDGGEIDLALVTEGRNVRDIEVLREDGLVWLAGIDAGSVEARRPLPLALPTQGIAGHHEAVRALEAADIEHTLFMLSGSYIAIGSALRSGQAVTVLPRSLVDARSVRICGPDSGLPPLPSIRYGLLAAAEPARTVSAFRDVVREAVLDVDR